VEECLTHPDPLQHSARINRQHFLPGAAEIELIEDLVNTLPKAITA